MIKALDVDAGYSPSKRADTWLKVNAVQEYFVSQLPTIEKHLMIQLFPFQVKRDYVEGLNDSLDLVPIGAWHGNGRKAGW